MTSRLCREGGEWGEIDVSACQRDEFRNISIKVSSNCYHFICIEFMLYSQK